MTASWPHAEGSKLPPRILVTGFRPFLGESVNPSELCLPALAKIPGVRTLVLPVEYEGAFRSLRENLESETYDGVLLLGQATGAKKIRLERVALNLMDATSADEAGIQHHETSIDPKGPTALLTDLPLREWWTALKDRHAIEISNSAGAFVCNATYYQMLNYLRTRPVAIPMLFVHLPLLPEQLAGKEPGTPSLSLSAAESALREIIALFQRHSLS